MENKQKNDSAINRKQRILIVKVVVAMTIFLLGMPFLMFLATTYYTNKGLAMDVFLMAHEYTDKVDDFYQKKNVCPTNLDIDVTITKQDIADKINFLTERETNTCYIALTFRSLNISLDGKTILLSKRFNPPSNNESWQCLSNINAFYTPKSCSTSLPKNLPFTN